MQLCGSSWYFGDSGCNVAGFAQQGADQEWKQVFDSEGVFLFDDPDHLVSGWPDLTAIPLKSGYDEYRWAWDGAAYALVKAPDGALPEGDAATDMGDGG